MNKQSIANNQNSQSATLHALSIFLQQNSLHRKKSNHMNILDSQQTDHDHRYSRSHFNYNFSAIPNRLITPYPIQPKLKIGQPNDKYEQEADRVAEQVMHMPEPSILQRKCACGGICPKCQSKQDEQIQPKISPLIQRQEVAEENNDEDLILAKSKTNSAPEVTSDISASIQSLGSGQPLSQSERNFFEPRFGADFSHVRVHTDSRAANAAKSINARAFTYGNNIVFGTGEYHMGTLAGNNLFAHELTHVVQQFNLTSNLPIMRSCNPESFYQTSSNYCRDDTFSPLTHSGKTCYREVPRNAGFLSCPPGDHVCFDSSGNCTESPDKSSPAESKESDGSCNWNWYCVGEHTAFDFLPAITPDVCTTRPDGSVRCPDGSTLLPDGRMILGPGPKI